MKKAKIFENFGLKILAVFISVLLWLIVINLSDPVTDIPFSDVPVQIINADTITSEGKVYELTSASSITISVTAKRSILDYLGNDNFKAIVDMSLYNEDTGTVPIRVESNKYSDKIESIKPKTDVATVNVEKMLRKQFVINPLVTGEPEDGYVLGDVTTAENIVRISGAESIVSSIRKVTAEVSVSGLSNNINTSVDLKLYNEKGELIKDNNLTKNISTVAVSAQILATKEVNLKFATSGEPADDYCVYGDIESDITSVLVAGKSSALNKIENLEIPSSAISIEGMNSSYTTVIDITSYLSDGLRLVDEENEGKVTVTVPIVEKTVKSFDIDRTDITMRNLPENVEAEILGIKSTIPVEVTGVAENVEAIKTGTIKAYIDWDAYMIEQDIDTLKPGNYLVDVEFSIPETITVTKSVVVNVKITKKED